MCRSVSGGPYTVDDLGEARRLIDEYAELAARLAACEDPRAELLRAVLLEAGARWASETMARLYALREIELTNGWESDGQD